MILRLRLKYKYLCAVVVFVALYLVLLFSDRLETKRCVEEEPVDVVYTWVNGSDPAFTRDLERFVAKRTGLGDHGRSRYTDRYELKFSLRSLEKYAPWIRNVYIVTNGQIPYWLNLDSRRVFVVTHADIFPDSKDLPTFSSPSIETHLHRIPGISKRFLYFNDDVYLGAPVYLDDFVTPSRGHLLYMEYPMQSCAEDCFWIYVRDGYCDAECNNAECQMDGGDCDVNQDLPLNTEHHLVLNSNQSDFQPSYLYLKNSSQAKHDLHPKNASDLLARLSDPSASNLTAIVEKHNEATLKLDKLKRRKKKKPGARNLRSKTSKSFDAYQESLRHTNRVYNTRFGFVPRYVPAHMPFLVDVEIMRELQAEFPEEFAATSSNRVRAKNDMQFAFSYFYYIYHKRVEIAIGDIFDAFDTDKSGTWSDREIRTLLTRIYELPLNNVSVDEFDALLGDCSKRAVYPEVSTPEYERYIDSTLPTISKELVVNCDGVRHVLRRNFGRKQKYDFELIRNVTKYVTFEMIRSDVQPTIAKLDKIRRNPKKFVCLNDNMVHNRNSSTINAIWYDFYLSVFPIPSEFELPTEYRNRFLHVDDLKFYHTKMKLFVYFSVIVTVYVTVAVMCKNNVFFVVRNKLFC